MRVQTDLNEGFNLKYRLADCQASVVYKFFSKEWKAVDRKQGMTTKDFSIESAFIYGVLLGTIPKAQRKDTLFQKVFTLDSGISIAP